MKTKKYEVVVTWRKGITSDVAENGYDSVNHRIVDVTPIQETITVEARNKTIAKLYSVDYATFRYMGNVPHSLIVEIKHDLLRNIVSITEVNAEE